MRPTLSSWLVPTAAQTVAGRARSLAHQDVGDRAHDRAPYIVAIDGRSGSGKTTVGGAVAHLLGDAPVIHMDDLYDGWQGAEAGSRLLVRDILEPIRRGEQAAYHRFDWESGAYNQHVIEVPTHKFLVVEGVLAMWGPRGPRRSGRMARGAGTGPQRQGASAGRGGVCASLAGVDA